MTGIANINVETGIPYGYISANFLDNDLVTELMDNGVNLSAAKAYQEWQAKKAAELQEEDEDLSDDEAKEKTSEFSYEFCETWEGYEDIIEGEKDGVKYRTSWLGGALNFYIFLSPYVTDHCRECSLCVPNAGNLDMMDGSYTAYDVPPDWRRNDD